MIKTLLSLIFVILLTLSGFSQGTKIFGTVKDAETGETLIGANVLIGEGIGTVTDYVGNFSIAVDDGQYHVQVSYVGYDSKTKSVEVSGKDVYLKITLETITLNEINIIADVARARETPVAFTNILPAKIEEELGGQDLPMVLNSTPGVYATQQGGGDGDARVNIRGFTQSNVAVLIDGVPVNDMENGWVYWSNWSGLDGVIRTIQVQRGLGASKLAIPSVGGTMNILTQGIEQKRKLSVKEEIGSGGYLKTSLGYNSGKLRNGWGFTFAGSYKRGNGWVDETWTRAWFYYGKVQKQVGNHIISFTATGAPQKHGQRKYEKAMERYDSKYANDLGIDSDYYYPDADNDGIADDTIPKVQMNNGMRYNRDWGYLNRWEMSANGDTIWGDREKLNQKVNYYHKPAFSLRDFWNVNDKLYISNIAYLSIGTGGGTGIRNTPDEITGYDANGQLDLQSIYNDNNDTLINRNMNRYLGWLYGLTGSPAVSGYDQWPNGVFASNYIYSSRNNHFWYGLLSTFDYKVSNLLEFSGGVDLRSYKGTHYREVYDLLGADYVISDVNQIQSSKIRKEGDKYSYYNDGLVRWGGLFGQVEYKTGNWSGFINVTVSNTGYKRIDYFKKKDLVLSDTTMLMAVGTSLDNDGSPNFVPDTVFHNGQAYTMNSPEARYAEIGWKWIPGFTIKSGANYNLNERMNVFINFGYMDKAPKMNSVYTYDNEEYKEIENETVKAFEIGYSYATSKFAANVNAYYTAWENKPGGSGSFELDDTTVINGISVPPRRYTFNINGMDALHKGVEFDFIYKFSSKLELQGLASIGDWRWTSKENIEIVDDEYLVTIDTAKLDARNIRVGDAAQTQYSASLRYEPIKRLYIKGQITYFDNFYSEFNPLDLDPEKQPQNFNENGTPRQSWQIPTYSLIDFHAGYGMNYNDVNISLKLSILNVFNQIYITDAENNYSYAAYPYTDFDAKSAGVFMGLGRRFLVSLRLTY